MHMHVVGNPRYGLEYEIVDTLARHSEAEQYCKNAGGNLAPMRSRNEQYFLDEFATSQYNCDGRLVKALRHTRRAN